MAADSWNPGLFRQVLYWIERQFCLVVLGSPSTWKEKMWEECKWKDSCWHQPLDSISSQRVCAAWGPKEISPGVPVFTYWAWRTDWTLNSREAAIAIVTGLRSSGSCLLPACCPPSSQSPGAPGPHTSLLFFQGFCWRVSKSSSGICCSWNLFLFQEVSHCMVCDFLVPMPGYLQ